MSGSTTKVASSAPYQPGHWAQMAAATTAVGQVELGDRSRAQMAEDSLARLKAERDAALAEASSHAAEKAHLQQQWAAYNERQVAAYEQQLAEYRDRDAAVDAETDSLDDERIRLTQSQLVRAFLVGVVAFGVVVAWRSA